MLTRNSIHLLDRQKEYRKHHFCILPKYIVEDGVLFRKFKFIEDFFPYLKAVLIQWLRRILKY